MAHLSALDLLGKVLKAAPVPEIPPGRILELPGRGSTYVVDTGPPVLGLATAHHDGAGPADEPRTLILLHALACTGLLTWYPCLEALSRRYRVVVYDQRWHGQGIRDGRFDLDDCADDVAAVADALAIDRFVVAGYSMGTLVGQLAAHRHPDRVAGLVLCAGATHFAEPSRQETVRRAGVRIAAFAERQRRITAEVLDQTADNRWAWRQFRATPGAAVTGAATVLARFDSRPWIGDVEQPAAVVVTARDRLIPAARQRALAQALPHSTSYEVDAGHVACVLGADRFRPALLAAVASVSSRLAVPR